MTAKARRDYTEADMRTLIANGADCIITDNPKLGCEVVSTTVPAAA